LLVLWPTLGGTNRDNYVFTAGARKDACATIRSGSDQVSTIGLPYEPGEIMMFLPPVQQRTCTLPYDPAVIQFTTVGLPYEPAVKIHCLNEPSSSSDRLSHWGY
jgi:hypothetical protein